MSLRRLAVSSLTLGIGLALGAAPAKTARGPRYGGTLRVEIGPVIQSLEWTAASSSAEEAAAKSEIDSLIYDLTDAKAAQPRAGPFRISTWEPGQRLALAANEDCPKGRPFIDAIEFTMGRAAKDRLLDLELGKTDFIEIPQDLARRAAEGGIRISNSRPDELLAILFRANGPNAPSEAVREAAGMAVDRVAIVNFILQKTGEPAGGLLPQWLSGTAFLFSTAADAVRAKASVEEIRAQNAASLRLVLGYDSGDSAGETVAERVVVDGREAGFSMTARALLRPAATATGLGATPLGYDARIVHWRVTSPQPGAALEQFLAAYPALATAAGSDCAVPLEAASAEAIYRCESAIVGTHEIVPLAFLPQVYGLSGHVHDWQAPGPAESWPLADVWLEANP
jgi:hypothetical protein